MPPDRVWPCLAELRERKPKALPRCTSLRLPARRSGVGHTEAESAEAEQREPVAITPFGTRLLAGPGSLSPVILYAHQADGSLPLSIALISVAVWLALPISAALGQIGVNIVMRLMGLVAVGVEFIARGVSALFLGTLGGAP